MSSGARRKGYSRSLGLQATAPQWTKTGGFDPCLAKRLFILLLIILVTYVVVLLVNLIAICLVILIGLVLVVLYILPQVGRPPVLVLSKQSSQP